MKYLQSYAEISPCQQYRYLLHRRWPYERKHPNDIRPWSEELPYSVSPESGVLWVCLNPSRATDEKIDPEKPDDPTAKKVVGFSDRWGYNSATIVNLYAYRAQNPKDMKAVIKSRGALAAIGPLNHERVGCLMRQYKNIVFAWGANARLEEAVPMAGLARSLGKEVMCLGITANGHPMHPLMLGYDTTRRPFPGITYETKYLLPHQRC